MALNKDTIACREQIIPHIGTATYHVRGSMGDLGVKNVISWFGGESALTTVAAMPQRQSPHQRKVG